MKIKQAIQRCLLVLSLCLLSVNLYAQSSPIVMLNGIAQNILSDLKRYRGQLRGNNHLVANIVNRRLLPYVDTHGMARSAVGRNAWRAASANQRQRFIAAFTRLVVHTYSGALSDFKDEVVYFHDIRGGFRGKRYVKVNSVIKRPRGGSDIPIGYSLVRRGNTWRIYDISVEGVSLLSSFRTQFSSELRQHGFEALIKKIQSKNSSFAR